MSRIADKILDCSKVKYDITVIHPQQTAQVRTWAHTASTMT
jgi:hypothetical protein